MKVLLIGKTGQLGQAILKDAPSFGFSVSAPNQNELDITKPEQVRFWIEKTQPNVLINTAAYNLVAQAEKEKVTAFQYNFFAIHEMAQLCKELSVKFVTYSTDYVLDGEEGKPNDENVGPRPLQVYGASKFAGEEAALKLYPEGSWVIRTCGLYGGGITGSPAKGNSVLNFLKAGVKEKSIEVSSEQIANPTFAEDLSVATFEILRKEASAGLYHLANEGYCSWAEFAQEIFRLVGLSVKVVPVDRGGLRGTMRVPKFSALLNTRALVLGIKLPGWKDALSRYINSIGGYSQAR